MAHRRFVAACVLAGLVSPAGAAPASTAPASLAEPLLPAPAASGVTVELRDFATLPRHRDDSAARVQFLCPAPDGTRDLFVLDAVGVIYRVGEDGRRVGVFLDLRTRPLSIVSPSGEEGLLGLAFHPNFAGDQARPGYGTFYTAYSADRRSGTPDFLADDDADHHQVIREWVAADPLAASFAGTSREVLRVGKYASNHNGGVIRFDPNARPGSPDYGNLYIDFGDGGGANDPRGNGQNLASPLGKILRIDPLGGAGGAKYAIPADNPFRGMAGAAPLVWAYGLRNPQQFSFESGGAGRMFIDDIGQNQVEEVDVGVRGANYGWQRREGTFATGAAVGSPGGKRDYGVYPVPAGDAAGPFTGPVAEYDHGDAERDGDTVAAAISSGFVYRGDAVPGLRGAYVFADLAQGRLFAIDAEPGADRMRPPRSIALRYDGAGYASLSESPIGEDGRSDLRLGEDANGELYALLKGPGAIYRIVPGR